MKNKDTSVSEGFAILAIVILSVSLLVVNYAWQKKSAWAQKLNDKLMKKELELDQANRNLFILKRDVDAMNKKLSVMIAEAAAPKVIQEPVPADVPAVVPETVPAAALPVAAETKS